MSLFKYWVASVSVCGSLISLWAGISGKGPGPAVLWFVVAYVALCFSFGLLWWEQHHLAKIGKALRDGLKQRHDALTKEWARLDSLYENSKKDEDAPKTFPDPMGSRQIGDWDFRYRVGCLQTKTLALLADCSKVGIKVDVLNEDIRSIPELLAVLKRCRL